jgi:hypothetical protein
MAMIEQIENLPDNALGFSAKGVITKADYETVIIPAVEAKFSKYTKVRVLYHIGEGFTKFESGALWDDAKIGFKYLKSWDRIAVVTDVDWMRSAVRIFAFLLPGPVRVFQNAEIAEAHSWISE